MLTRDARLPATRLANRSPGPATGAASSADGPATVSSAPSTPGGSVGDCLGLDGVEAAISMAQAAGQDCDAGRLGERAMATCSGV
eukprot:4935898-Pyramimonas_sp.AAC.1